METITIKDIAKICGVGVSTVSRAINNHPDINEETKLKILQTIKENNYVPNNSARNLKLSEAKVIAVLVKGITNTFFGKIIRIMEDEMHNNDYSLFLTRVDDAEDEIDVALQLIKEKRLQGIIFLGGNFNHTTEKLKKITVPFVLCTIDISSNVDKSIYSSVSVDDLNESYTMVNYLCKLGHKKIAIITARKEDKSIGKLRLDGYLKALEENHIEVEENLVMVMDENLEQYSMENGYVVMNRFLEKKIECSAVFAISDQLAVGASKAILESGRRIPEDISVAGFDGMELSKYYNPSITTMRQPVEDMSKATIEILFGMINRLTSNKHIVYKGELILGDSTSKYKSNT